MNSPLTPDLALAYLRELSLDVRTAIVVDGDGRRLAGPAELLTPARAILGDPAAASGLAIPTTTGWVFAVHSGSVGMVTAADALALPGLLLHDVCDVVALLSGGRPGNHRRDIQVPVPETLRALGEAVQRAAEWVPSLSSGDR